MIIQAFINIAYLIINFIVSQFPDSTGFPQEVHDAVATLAGYIGGMLGIFSPMIPLATMALALGTIFTVEMLILGFKSFRWIMSHIPWIGGKGN